jgi:RIO kinase 1
MPFAPTGDPDRRTALRPTGEGVDRRYRPPREPIWDDDVPEPDRTSYGEAQPGPEPIPDWVVTDDDAWDTELGLLKTGKEADVSLVERRTGDGSRVTVLAAKRYRTSEHSSFKGGRRYSVARSTGDSRTDRAIATKTSKGRVARARTWAEHEFDVLGRLWSAGAAVPYPVQLLDVELMVELVGSQETREAAPRLATAHIDRAQAHHLWPQALALLEAFTAAGLAHADLSPYNILVHEDRLVAIDMPQAADLITHPEGLSFLQRDCVNLCGWFQRNGVDEADPDRVYADLLTLVW